MAYLKYKLDDLIHEKYIYVIFRMILIALYVLNVVGGGALCFFLFLTTFANIINIIELQNAVIVKKN